MTGRKGPSEAGVEPGASCSGDCSLCIWGACVTHCATCFRLPRHVIIELCNNLDARLKRETRRSNALPVPVQVLATLGFLATRTFQREIGDRLGSLSQTSAGRCQQYIRFPYNDAQQSVIKRQFYEIAGFPNLVGAIDCTHVCLKAPSMNDSAFINRKNYHSINVQVICDARGHTRFFYFSKQLCCNLLGDKGYPFTEYLITPLANPATEQERRFNSAHTRTRVTVECCFGLLKGRWLCLGPAGRTLLYTPEKVCDIILACSVLHNIALVNGVPFDVPVQPDEPMPMEPWPVQPPLGAIRRRQDLIHRF
uniref:DDE Tnp4 domain-containing protein n=1 Tax=Seriola dumerili TaxID=41447 RepID=A0A3B4VHQ6_SERDU